MIFGINTQDISVRAVCLCAEELRMKENLEDTRPTGISDCVCARSLEYGMATGFAGCKKLIGPIDPGSA